jgi:hypothetical protein
LPDEATNLNEPQSNTKIRESKVIFDNPKKIDETFPGTNVLRFSLLSKGNQ